MTDFHRKQQDGTDFHKEPQDGKLSAHRQTARTDRLDELLFAAAEEYHAHAEKPPKELNNRLKAELYQRERILRRQPETRSIRLWYIPMLLSFIVFSLLAVSAVLTITNAALAILAVAGCVYAVISCFILTMVAVSRTNIKEELSLHL